MKENRDSKAVRQYLERYAEPETAIARAVAQRFEQAVSLPACGEGRTLWETLESLKAAQHPEGGVLLILTVNAPEDGDPAWHTANGVFLARLKDQLTSQESLGPHALLGQLETLAVLALDRASEGNRMPVHQGVGLARKIGADIALGLWAAGKLEDYWLLHTDADALVPRDFFRWPKPEGNPAVCYFPFTHLAAPEATKEEFEALVAYECSLRYLRLGLAWAGSPHARHTLGSTLITRLDAYAAVRGFPKREAAEDFHLLDKLWGQGGVQALARPVIRLQGRPSNRVPFGTGRSMSTWSASKGGYTFYHPAVFEALRDCLASLAKALPKGEWEAPACAPDSLRRDLLPLLHRWRQECPDASSRATRLHQWLGGLRTLKLLHYFRDAIWPNLPWEEALRSAAFTPAPHANGLQDWADVLWRLDTGLPKEGLPPLPR